MAHAVAKIPETKIHAARGKELVRLINQDLEWLRRKLEAIEARVRISHPIEYSQSKDKFKPGGL